MLLPSSDRYYEFSSIPRAHNPHKTLEYGISNELSYSEMLANELNDVEYHTIEGSSHGFYGEDFNTALSYIIPFLNSHLD